MILTERQYGRSEPRIPLHGRMAGEWTLFEAKVLNLVTHYGDRQGKLFMPQEKRVRIAQAMLQAYDAEVVKHA